MDQEAVAQQLRRFIIAELLYASELQELDPDDDLLAGGILDSMSAARLATHMEEIFGIEVAPTDFTFENFNTLGSLAELVVRKRAQDDGKLLR